MIHDETITVVENDEQFDHLWSNLSRGVKPFGVDVASGSDETSCSIRIEGYVLKDFILDAKQIERAELLCTEMRAEWLKREAELLSRLAAEGHTLKPVEFMGRSYLAEVKS